jgi:hypothetical protein
VLTLALNVAAFLVLLRLHTRPSEPDDLDDYLGEPLRAP